MCGLMLIRLQNRARELHYYDGRLKNKLKIIQSISIRLIIIIVQSYSSVESIKVSTFLLSSH